LLRIIITAAFILVEYKQLTIFHITNTFTRYFRQNYLLLQIKVIVAFNETKWVGQLYRPFDFEIVIVTRFDVLNSVDETL